MTLILAALLSSVATVRESQCLTAMVRIHTCGDWLGGASGHLELAPLMCGAGDCVALCLGECTPGQGSPVVSTLYCKETFLKKRDLAELFGLRIASFCAWFLLPRSCVCSSQGEGVYLPSNYRDDNSQGIFFFSPHQVNTWFVWGNLSSVILSLTCFP